MARIILHKELFEAFGIEEVPPEDVVMSLKLLERIERLREH